MSRIPFRIFIVCLALSLVFGIVPPLTSNAQTLEVLLANLKSPVAKTRREAAKKLGEQRRLSAADELALAAAKDSDTKVRENALWALGQMKDFRHVPAMIDGLADNFEDVRRAAVLALVSLYMPEGTGFIFNRRRGLNVLNPFLDTNDRAVVDERISVDDRVTTALARVVLTDRSDDMRLGSVRALGVLRAAATVPELVRAMVKDEKIRVDVLRTFIKFGISENGKYAIPYFSSTDHDTRGQAIAATGELHSREAIVELLSQYRHFAEWQKDALHALAQIPAGEAEEVFVANLQHKDEDRRQYANEGLGRIEAIKHAERIAKLRESEKDSNVLLAQSFALYLLGRHDHLAYVVQKTDTLTLDDQAGGYLVEIPRVADLYPYLRQGTIKQRKKVAEALGRIGNAGTIQKLQEQLQNQNDSGYADTLNLAIERIKWRETNDKRPRRAARNSDGKNGATEDATPPKKRTRPRRVEP